VKQAKPISIRLRRSLFCPKTKNYYIAEGKERKNRGGRVSAGPGETEERRPANRTIGTYPEVFLSIRSFSGGALGRERGRTRSSQNPTVSRHPSQEEGNDNVPLLKLLRAALDDDYHVALSLHRLITPSWGAGACCCQQPFRAIPELCKAETPLAEPGDARPPTTRASNSIGHSCAPRTG